MPRYLQVVTVTLLGFCKRKSVKSGDTANFEIVPVFKFNVITNVVFLINKNITITKNAFYT